MNWFVANIIYRIISGEGDHVPQFEEQLKLISAKDERRAFEKASIFGKNEQDIFPNIAGENVQWKFVGIASLTKINSLEDGAELFSKIFEDDNGNNYVKYIGQKNYDIESR